MAAYIKTLQEIYIDMLNAHADAFGIDLADIGDTLKVTYKVIASEIYVGFLAISKSQNNMYPDISEESELIRDGYYTMGRYPKTATVGTYNVQVTGIIGASIPENTRFQSNANSTSPEYLYILDSEFILGSTTDIIQLRALTPGRESVLVAGDGLTSMQPLTSISNNVIVESVIIDPIDKELIEEYRKDVLQFKRLEPQGGSGSDYFIWASEQSAVRAIYVYTDEIPGNITIAVECTENNTVVGELIGTPSQNVIDSIYKNEAGVESGLIYKNPSTGMLRKPLWIRNITIIGVEHSPIDILLTDLSNINYAQNIRESLQSYLYEKRPYIASINTLSSKNDTITLGEVINTVYQSIAGTGVTVSNIVLRVDGVEVNEYTYDYVTIPYLRQIYNNLAII